MQMDPIYSFVEKTFQDSTKIKAGQVVHVVIGNESCDLDSTVCAITYAYYLREKTYKDDDTVIVLPIMNLLKKNFPLRTENSYVLRKFHISIDMLLFRDTISLVDLSKNNILKITLVDHHVIRGDDAFMKEYVVEVYDHRPEDANAGWDKEKVAIKINEVASCSTIIANKFFETQAENILSKGVATYLYETLVFYATGLDKNAKTRFLEHDVADKLEPIVECSRPRQTVFQDIILARIERSTYHILCSDMKNVKKVYIAKVPKLVRDFLALKGAFEAMEKFCHDNSTQSLVLMGMEAEPTLARDVAFFPCYHENRTLFAVINSLRANENLFLVEIICPVKIPRVKYFLQYDTRMSRDDVIPLIGDIVENNLICCEKHRHEYFL